VKRLDEKGDAGAVRRIGVPVDAELAKEDRLTLLRDGKSLRDRERTGIRQVRRLKVHLELVRNPEGVA